MNSARTLVRPEDIQNKEGLRVLLRDYRQYYELETRLKAVNEEIVELDRTSQSGSPLRRLGLGRFAPPGWYKEYSQAALTRMIWSMTLSNVLAVVACWSMGLNLVETIPPVTFLIPVLIWVLYASDRNLARRWVLPLTALQRLVFTHFGTYKMALAPVREIYFPYGLNAKEMFADIFGCMSLWGIGEALPVLPNAVLAVLEWAHYIVPAYYTGDMFHPVTQRFYVSRAIATVVNLVAALYFERVARGRTSKGKQA